MTAIMPEIMDKDASTFVSQEEDSSFSDHNLAQEGWILFPQQEGTNLKSHCVKIYQGKNKLAGIAWVTPAENSLLHSVVGISRALLDRAIMLEALWISPEAKGWTPALLYLALRRGRIWKRKQIIVLTENIAHLSLLRLEAVDNITSINIEGKQLSVYAQQLHYALHLCYQHSHGEPLHFINSEFSTEIIETAQLFLQRFFRNKFSLSVMNRTMSKQQYIQCLFNTHSYVRYTTRLIARSIAFSDNIELRNHYIEHLKGEINHEKIIERDLKHLGADIEYLTKYFVPNLATKEFMVTQESTIGFYQNPVLMLACPLAAEGITAVITQDFLDALRNTISIWGVKQPEEAMRFISSHSHTDGGEDGHWENVKKMVKRLIHSETTLQQFLGIYEIASEGLQRSFDSSIEENELWNRISV